MRQLRGLRHQPEFIGKRQRVLEEASRRVDDDAHRHLVPVLDLDRAVVAAQVILAFEQRDVELLLHEVCQGNPRDSAAYDCQFLHVLARFNDY